MFALAIVVGVTTGAGVWLFKQLIEIANRFFFGVVGRRTQSAGRLDGAAGARARRIDRGRVDVSVRRRRTASRRGGHHGSSGVGGRPAALQTHSDQNGGRLHLDRRGSLGRAGRSIGADRRESGIVLRASAAPIRRSHAHVGGGGRGGRDLGGLQCADRRHLLRAGIDHRRTERRPVWQRGAGCRDLRGLYASGVRR